MAWVSPSTRTTGTLITASIWNADVVANPIAIYAGAMSIASQAANDIIYASSATQLTRLAAIASGFGLLYSQGGAPAWSYSPEIRNPANTEDGPQIRNYSNGNAAAATLTFNTLNSAASGNAVMFTIKAYGAVHATLADQVVLHSPTTAELIVRTSGVGAGKIHLDSKSAMKLSTDGAELATGALAYTNATGVTSVTTLPSAVVGSSLTSVGTITSGAWNAGAVTSSGAFLSTKSNAGLRLIPTTGTAAAYIEFTNTGGGGYVGPDDSTASQFSLGNYAFNVISGASPGINIAATHASGDIRFYAGGTTIKAKLEASTGDWYTNDGTVSSLSDARTKDRIADFVPGMDAIRGLVTDPGGIGLYQHKSGLNVSLPTSDRPFVGVTAQAARRHVPESVVVGADGYLRFKSDPVFWAGMRAIVDADDHLRQHDARLSALEARMN